MKWSHSLGHGKNFTTLPVPDQISYGIARGDTLYFCGTCSGLVTNASWEAHDNFHATFTNRTDGSMSSVLWCDRGDHAFKAGSPGAVTFTGTQTDADGVPQTISIDACAEHNPYAPPSVKEELERKRLTAQAEEELKAVSDRTHQHPYM